MRAAFVVLALLGVLGCADTSAVAHTQAQPVPVAPPDCTDSKPCTLHAGTYRLSNYIGVLGGLRVTVPLGWVSPEDETSEFALRPRGRASERLAVWLDISAVKSSGHGHGTVLSKVGTTAAGLTNWFTHDSDLQVVAGPTATTIGNGIKATTFALGVSTAADYGDRMCPANPRCADLVRNPATWQSGDTFSIGGTEQVRLFLAPITSNGSIHHTLTIALDAANHSQLVQLTKAAESIVASIRLPSGITGG